MPSYVGWFALWEHHELAALTDPDPVSEVYWKRYLILLIARLFLKLGTSGWASVGLRDESNTREYPDL